MRIFVKLFLLAIAILILGIVRFNRDDTGISNLTIPDSTYDPLKSNDAIRYINMTNYYRGHEKAENLIPPYTTRVLMPFIASKLPYAADTSLNILNYACMIASMLILYFILRLLNLSENYAILGCVLFVFSFPVFYYGTVTYVDPALILILFLGTYYIFKDNFPLLCLTVFIGTAVKETSVLLIPVFFIHQLSKGNKFFTSFIKTFLLLLVYFLSSYILVLMKPNDLYHIWLPTREFIGNNLSRPRTYLSFVLTFGIPGFVSIFAILYFYYRDRSKLRQNATLISGILISILLWVYSILSAYTDGRFIWPSVVFSIPLTVIFIEYYQNKRQRKLTQKLSGD